MSALTNKLVLRGGVSLCAVILLFACTRPIPTEKSSYVDEWRSADMFLMIMPDGSLKYVRIKDKETTKINAPIKEFDGNNIVVGIGPATTTFVVNKPPYQDDGRWKMVVDNDLLTKIHN
jgi:hypothetical protein